MKRQGGFAAKLKINDVKAFLWTKSTLFNYIFDANLIKSLNYRNFKHELAHFFVFIIMLR